MVHSFPRVGADIHAPGCQLQANRRRSVCAQACSLGKVAGPKTVIEPQHGAGRSQPFTSVSARGPVPAGPGCSCWPLPMKSVHLLVLLLVASLAGRCWASGSNTLSRSEQNLRAIWTATNSMAQQRAAAVNSCFTNGTPITRVLAILGKWDEHHQTFTTLDPSDSEYRGLVYRFGSDRITVRAKGTPGTRTENCTFAGAFAWRPADVGRQLGPVNRSLPVRSETNRSPPAAGSGRSPRVD